MQMGKIIGHTTNKYKYKCLQKIFHDASENNNNNHSDLFEHSAELRHEQKVEIPLKMYQSIY